MARSCYLRLHTNITINHLSGMAVADYLVQDPSRESLESALPLSPLRISTPSRHESVPSETPRKRASRKPPKLRNDTGPGFDLDVVLPDPEGSEEHSESSEMLGKANRLATVLMNSGKVISSKFNVVDALSPTDVNKSDGHIIHISRATRARAETVKAMLAVKYHWLGRNMETPEDGHNAHPGVEGVYNPLQVIRNRAVRALHQEPAPPTLRSLPLACNVFSSRRKPGQRPRKMLWGVELNEFINDMAWRLSRWHELRKPSGELWFPDPNSKAEPERQKSTKHRHRMHDTLFTSVHSDNTSLDDTSSNRNSKLALDTDINVYLVPIEQARPKQGISLRLRPKNRKQYRSSILASDSAEDSEHTLSRSYESLLNVRISRAARSSLREESDLDDVVKEAEDEELDDIAEPAQEVAEVLEPRQSDVKPPVIIINDNASVSDIATVPDLEEPDPTSLQEVVFRPMHLAKSLEIEAQEKPLETPPVDIAGQRLTYLGNKQSYLDKLLFVDHNYLTSICPRTVELVHAVSEHLLHEEFGPLFRDIIDINDNQLPAYENFYSGFIGESKSLIHMANANYAVQIDNLLSATDRSMGEINTSLSMDLRKLSEHLDRVNKSLFGSIVSDRISPLNVPKFNETSNYQTLYFLLENSIVIVLRIIWIVVNIYKSIAYVFLLFWRVLRLIFF